MFQRKTWFWISGFGIVFLGKRVSQFSMCQGEWPDYLMKRNFHFILAHRRLCFLEPLLLEKKCGFFWPVVITFEPKNKRECVRFLCAYYFLWRQLKKAWVSDDVPTQMSCLQHPHHVWLVNKSLLLTSNQCFTYTLKRKKPCLVFFFF